MNATWVAIILAVVAIAVAVFALIKLYMPIAQSQVTGLPDISTSVTALKAQSAINAGNIDLINEQLGVVDTATSSFTTTAASAVTPAFPLSLD